MEKGTKYRLLYLYDYLVKHTDIDHPLSTNQLIQAMQEEYDIHVGRNTISEDLAVMKECGLPVDFHDSTQNLYYYDSRVFELPELKLLIDAVASSKFITQKKSDELIAKLLALTNDSNAAKLRRQVTVAGRVKGENEKGYYIVDSIHAAIDAKRKIRFFYTDYNVNKELILANDGLPYTLSPYTLIWDGDYYYVRGYCDERRGMRNFRIDRIGKNPVVLADTAVPAPEEYDPAKYSREVFRMFDNGEPEEVILYCDVSVFKAVIDNFGTEVESVPIDDRHVEVRVFVCTSPTFFRWVFGFEGKIRIMGPGPVWSKYREMIWNELERK